MRYTTSTNDQTLRGTANFSILKIQRYNIFLILDQKEVINNFIFIKIRINYIILL